MGEAQDGLGNGRPTADLVRYVMLLGSGQYTGPAADVVGDDPAAVLARLDLAVRGRRAGVIDVHRTRGALAAEIDADPVLGWWSAAILAECLVLDGDLHCSALAERTVAEMPTDPFAAPHVLYIRARLHRVAGLGPLLAADHGVTQMVQRRDTAILDFLRAGVPAEATLTRGLYAGLRTILNWEEPKENLVRLLAARAELHDDGQTMWGPALDVLIAWVAFVAGDLAVVADSYTRVEGRVEDMPLLSAMIRFGRAVARLWGEQGSREAVDAFAAELDAVQGRTPRAVHDMLWTAVNALVDVGSREAHRFATRLFDLPVVDPVVELEHRLLRIRLHALGGTVPELADIKTLLEEMTALGRSRQAANAALRLARDCDRIGSVSDAQVLREWADVRLPEPSQRTFWELWWGMSADTTAPSPSSPSSAPSALDRDGGPPVEPRIDIRVMVPALDIRHGGAAVRVREPVAKLLLALLVVHPAPVHVEQAMDVLWPDASPDAARSRLNTVVHRLRGALGDGGVLSRDGDLLVLDLSAVRVDLCEYRAALREEGRRGDALRALQGNLCQIQFPYDDRLIDERHRLAAEWRRHAAELLRAGVVTRADLSPAAAALGVDLDDL